MSVKNILREVSHEYLCEGYIEAEASEAPLDTISKIISGLY